MKKLIAVAAVALALVGCTAVKTPLDKDYEFGDTTKSLLALQAQYCTETNPAERALLLVAIRSLEPAYPASGACTQVELILAEEIAKEVAKGAPTKEYEEALEQAKKDAEKFKDGD